MTEELYDALCKENSELRKALQAVLEFYDGAEWTLQKGLLWARLTGSSEATTRILCNTVRKALAIGGNLDD